MDNTSTNTAVQSTPDDTTPVTSPTTTTSKTGFAYVVAVITALASGNMAGIPSDISLYVAVGILIIHAVMELIPRPSPDSWLLYPYKFFSGLGGNFKWAEQKIDEK